MNIPKTENSPRQERHLLDLAVGKSYALCKWMKDNRGAAKDEFMKIVPQKKNMSQLRQEILETLQEYLQETGKLALSEALDQDKPVSYLGLSPEEELHLLIFLEKRWKARFSENAAIEFAQNADIGTTADLITIVIKTMNGTE